MPPTNESTDTKPEIFYDCSVHQPPVPGFSQDETIVDCTEVVATGEIKRRIDIFV